MITRIFFKVFLIFLVSCGKEDINEYAVGTSQDGIVGRWKLVETSASDGTSRVIKTDVSSKNYIVTFDSNGNVEAPDFPCSGKYIFDQDKPGNKGDNNLVVTFENCESHGMVNYTIKGQADARVENHNSLVLSSEHCDEPCRRIFRRLK